MHKSPKSTQNKVKKIKQLTIKNCENRQICTKIKYNFVKPCRNKIM